MTEYGLQQRIELIRERIRNACDRCGRAYESVELIAVTKTKPVGLLQSLIDAGISSLGENRVNEIIDKVPQLHGTFTMHMIGHLQTNKVARVLPHVQMVQSVDRERLIGYIEQHLPEDRKMPVLMEVNTSGESSKNGCAPDDCRMLVERLAGSEKCVLKGLMTIGPLYGDEKVTRDSFALLRRIAEKNSDIIADPVLSMGMSGDFEWAIEEGSTMIRVGSLLCGGRNR
jgi:PLP dependent protein